MNLLNDVLDQRERNITEDQFYDLMYSDSLKVVVKESRGGDVVALYENNKLIAYSERVGGDVNYYEVVSA